MATATSAGRWTRRDEAPAWDPDRTGDLRRRRERSFVDRVLEWSSWLPDADRALLEAVYRDGRTAVEIAALSGDSPRAVRRRVRAALRRVTSPKLRFVVGAGQAWSPTRRKIARVTVVEGRSMRDAARELGVSYHTVRRHCDAIEALFAAASGAGSSRR